MTESNPFNVTGAVTVDINGKCHRFIRLQNIWSTEWLDTAIGQRDAGLAGSRKMLSHLSPNERLITVDEFSSHIRIADMCHLPTSPDLNSCLADYTNRKWSFWQVKGIWPSACGLADGSVWKSPQYVLKVEQRYDNRNLLVCDLHQPVSVNLKFLQVRLYRVKGGVEIRMDKSFDRSELERVHTSGSYLNQECVSLLAFLQSGFYVILPTIYRTGERSVDDSYLMRVLISNQCNSAGFFDLSQNEADLCTFEIPNQKSFPYDNIKLIGDPIKVPRSRTIRVEIPVRFLSLKNIIDGIELACVCNQDG